MPKRKLNNKVQYYENVLKKLKLQAERRRVRIISSDSSDSNDQNEENDQVLENVLIEAESHEDRQNDEEMVNTDYTQESTVPAPQLSSDLLTALGDSTEDTPKFGPDIHDSLAKLWVPILKKGLDKEAKDKLLKQHVIPKNCTLLQAPKLNLEISAAVNDATVSRDKRIESVQQHLGASITALNRGLEIMLNDGDKLQAVRYLSESCRLLCDMHFIETQARKRLVTPSLDKSFLTVIQDVERDDTLFGSKLSEKIKASKAIEKQGLQIKRAPTNVKISTAQPSNISIQPRSVYPVRSQGNWTGPPRFPLTNRGGRGGQRKSASAARGLTAPAVASPQSRSAGKNKHQAPAPPRRY